MAQFKAINDNVEVNRQTVMSFVNSMEMNKVGRVDVLKRNGIDLDASEEWFKQQDWLNAFKEVSEKVGDMNLFLIGKAIIKNAKFPPIKDLKEGLSLIDVAYHMNHRLDGEIMFNESTGKMLEGIGHYRLASFNSDAKSAIMYCDNPYPSKFDEGIITQIVRMFKPAGAIENVQLDLSKETRIKGGNSCTYLVYW